MEYGGVGRDGENEGDDVDQSEDQQEVDLPNFLPVDFFLRVKSEIFMANMIIFISRIKDPSTGQHVGNYISINLEKCIQNSFYFLQKFSFQIRKYEGNINRNFTFALPNQAFLYLFGLHNLIVQSIIWLENTWLGGRRWVERPQL